MAVKHCSVKMDRIGLECPPWIRTTIDRTVKQLYDAFRVAGTGRRPAVNWSGVKRQAPLLNVQLNKNDVHFKPSIKLAKQIKPNNQEG